MKIFPLRRRKPGKTAVALAKKGVKASDIVTLKSFENAIMVHAAISGSTNTLMHLARHRA